eukprot:m.1136995 g.1136995  ORF g.1136995 m.1136995 type:complete len:55 (-) comp24433_c0_seq18:2217-2381(-)
MAADGNIDDSRSTEQLLYWALKGFDDEVVSRVFRGSTATYACLNVAQLVSIAVY